MHIYDTFTNFLIFFSEATGSIGYVESIYVSFIKKNDEDNDIVSLELNDSLISLNENFLTTNDKGMRFRMFRIISNL